MIRVSLPIRGVAVVLLCASAAAAQAPVSTADFSDDYPSPFTPEAIWQKAFGETFPSPDDFATPPFSSILPVRWRYETEMPPSLDTGASVDLPTFGNFVLFDSSASKDAKDGKDAKASPRLTPMPSSGAPASPMPSSGAPASPPQGSPSGGGQGSPSGGGQCSPFDGGQCSPFDGGQCAPFDGGQCAPFDGGQCSSFGAGEAFPCVPTLLPFACSPPPCHKHCRRHKCCHGGGCCSGYGGCANFCAPPCCGHKCHRKHGHCCQNNYGGYPGCGYAGCGGPGGMGGGMGCDGFMGSPCPTFFCQPCSCRKCRKHGCGHGGCGYGGYGYGGYPGFDDGFGAFMDPCCYGGCGKCHGRFHRCHGCKNAPLCYPCPCFGFAMQPCMDMDMGMGMGMMGMGMGSCSDCSMQW
jgi:hypothetical protein